MEGVPQTGEIIAGKFQVEDVLGTGGMGVVVAARHLMLRQRVAVKFLLPQATQLPEARVRFVREARAAATITSEHVARVIDIGSLDRGLPYMVMEFLSGIDFAKLLKQHGPLPVEEALDYLLQAGEAVAEAHAHGIVHRDLKPGNLFLTWRADGSPLVKVLDFGLSKAALMLDDEVPEVSLTATGIIAGSPHYMAPEQVRALKNVDWRADVWALGAILYQMLTGRRAFEAPSMTAVCASIVTDPPVPMRALRPEIPPELEDAVMACLEKDPDLRTPSVAALAQTIAPFAPPSSWPSIERILRLSPSARRMSLPDGYLDGTAMMRASIPPMRVSLYPAPRAPSAAGIAAVPWMISGPGTAIAPAPSPPAAKRSPVGWITGGVGVLLGVAAVVRALGSAAVPAAEAINVVQPMPPASTSASASAEPTAPASAAPTTEPAAVPVPWHSSLPSSAPTARAPAPPAKPTPPAAGPKARPPQVGNVDPEE